MHLPRTVLTIALAATTATALPSFRPKQPANDDMKCDGTTCSHTGRYDHTGGRQEKRSERGGDGGQRVTASWKDDEGYPKSSRLVGEGEHLNDFSGEREGSLLARTFDKTGKSLDQLQFSSGGGKGGAPLTVARTYYPSGSSEGAFGDFVTPQQDSQVKGGDKGGIRGDFAKGTLRGNPDDFHSVPYQGGKTNPDDFYSGDKGGSPVLVPRHFHNRGPKQVVDSERKGGAPLKVNGNFHGHGLNDFEAQPVNKPLQTRQSDFQAGRGQDCAGDFCSATATQDRWAHSNGHGNTQDFVGGRNGDDWTKQEFVPVRGGGSNGLGNTQDFVGGRNGDGVAKQDWVGKGHGLGNTQDFIGKNGDGVTKQEWVRPASIPLQTRQSSGAADKTSPFTASEDLTKRPECIEMATNPGFRGVNGDLTC